MEEARGLLRDFLSAKLINFSFFSKSSDLPTEEERLI
ncbi:hypothetical protein IMSAGC021_01056 [Muribaculaceae bacterium]|nr:hypothetical protein IMSAGC021_01056 [Muribaculaceae bacterium]